MDTLITPPILQLRDPLVGSRLGEYEVLEPIGEGGMGVVYRGVHPLIKKRVAIKVLKPGASTDASHVKRLLAEAEAVNSIGHRNIVDIFGLGQLADGRPYIVMELLEGEPLDAYLRANRRLPLHEVLTLLLEIASPLAAAHAKGVIHRDLKPSNVFLCQQAEGGRYVKLLDFGLAKKALEGGSSSQTSQHVIAGTPDYMAPEQARARPVSARTDIYAFGAMGYEMLTGSAPFGGQTPMDVMMAHVSQPVPSVRALVPSLPPALDLLVRRMMAKAPEDRPQSMVEVRAELRALLATLSPTGSYQRLEPAPDRPTSSNEMPAVQLKTPAATTDAALVAVSQSRTPMVVAGAVAAALALGLVVATRRDGPVPEPVAPTARPALEPVPVPSPAVVTEPAPTPATAAEAAPVPTAPGEPPGTQSAGTAGVRPPAPTVGARPRPPRRAERAEKLRQRIDAMRRELERLTPAGELNPTDARLLGSYALEVFKEDADLDALERKLAGFERDVLRPLRRN
jgi:serine/threonine-protein kinase